MLWGQGRGRGWGGSGGGFQQIALIHKMAKQVTSPPLDCLRRWLQHLLINYRRP